MIPYNFSVPNPCDYSFLISMMDAVDGYGYHNCNIKCGIITIIGDHESHQSDFNDAYSAAIDSYDHSIAEIACAIESKAIEITAHRESVIYGDFKYENAVFDGDKISQEKIVKIIETNNTIERMRIFDPNIPPIDVNWILKNNSVKALSSADIDAINLQLMAKTKESYEICYWHKSILFSKATLAEVNEYDYSAGWPS